MEDFKKADCLARHHTLTSLAVHLWLLNVSANVENKQRWQNADEEHCSPRNFRWQYREHKRITKRRESPADCPAGLHGPHSLAPMAGANRFSHQHRAHCPLAAKAQALQCSRDKELPPGVGQSAQECEKCEPRNCELKDAHPAIPVR